MIELAGVARDNEAMQDIFEKYDNDITLVFEFESDTRADVFYVDDAIDGGRLMIQIRRKWNHDEMTGRSEWKMPEWLTVRAACRKRAPLDGVDAEALEHALTQTEAERDAQEERVRELEAELVSPEQLDILGLQAVVEDAAIQILKLQERVRELEKLPTRVDLLSWKARLKLLHQDSQEYNTTIQLGLIINEMERVLNAGGNGE